MSEIENQNPEPEEKPTDSNPQEVDKSTDETKKEPVENKSDEFDPEKYLKSLEPEEEKPDVKALQQENTLLKQQRDALKDAYLKLKSNGITLVSNPQSQNTADPNKQADEMLKKWMHS